MPGSTVEFAPTGMTHEGTIRRPVARVSTALITCPARVGARAVRLCARAARPRALVVSVPFARVRVRFACVRDAFACVRVPFAWVSDSFACVRVPFASVRVRCACVRDAFACVRDTFASVLMPLAWMGVSLAWVRMPFADHARGREVPLRLERPVHMASSSHGHESPTPSYRANLALDPAALASVGRKQALTHHSMGR